MSDQTPGADMGESLAMQPVTLPNDFGTDLSFTGQLIAEHSHYDQATDTLTKESLYRTDDGWTAYGVVSGSKGRKERRAYLIEQWEDDSCFISDGAMSMSVNPNDLIVLLAISLEEQGKAAQEAGFGHIRGRLSAVNE